jgi:hypothetical protein
MVDRFILRLADQAAPPPPELRILLGVPVRRDLLAVDQRGDGRLTFASGYVGRPTGAVTTVADGELAEIYLVDHAIERELCATIPLGRRPSGASAPTACIESAV